VEDRPAHTAVTFSVRHLMSRVRGRFGEVDGQTVIGSPLASCSVEASIATASVDTGTRMRDDDLRSEGFLDSARFPAMRFASTQIRGADPSIALVGDLTIRDVTRPVAIDVEFLGLDETGLQGEPRVGFSGRTAVRRSDVNVGESSVEGSKVVVGDVVAHRAGRPGLPRAVTSWPFPSSHGSSDRSPSDRQPDA
jgi:polyisoprenoid-binding protein YceI